MLNKILLAALLFTVAQKAPDGEALLNKALDRYDYVKTVQAEGQVLVPPPVGNQGPTDSVFLKAYIQNNGKGYIAKSRIEYTSSQGKWIKIDDGSKLYTLDPAQKLYFSEPRQKDRFSALFRPTVERMRTRGVKFRASEARSEDKPVYVVQGNSIDGFTAQVVLGKERLKIQQLTVKSPTGRVVNQIVMGEQTYDAPIDSSLFQVPSDYKPADGGQ
ncbi:MAG: hypothetical protein OHK0029_36080 [Armatimonadaceae bacterium]